MSLIDKIKSLKKPNARWEHFYTKEERKLVVPDKSMYDISYSKSAIVIGNEANGVSEGILDLADERLKIPMIGRTESLNASVATAVILYEAMRGKLKK